MLKVPRGTTGANREPLFLKGVKTSLELHKATYLLAGFLEKSVRYCTAIHTIIITVYKAQILRLQNEGM